MRPSKRKMIVMVLGLLPGFLLASSARATTSMASQPVVRQPLRVVVHRRSVTVALAPALQRAMTRYFPGYRLPIKESERQMVFDLANGSSTEEAARFVCTGDFDGNGLPDVALYLLGAGLPHRLRHHRIPRRRWLLVAFHQTFRGTFRPYTLARRYDPEFWRNEYTEALNSIRDDSLVRKPSGARFAYAYSRAEGYIRMRLRHDAVSEGWSETETIYYFHNGTYHHVDTIGEE